VVVVGVGVEVVVVVVVVVVAANTSKIFVLFCWYRFFGSNITATLINLLNPIRFFTYRQV
jgi:hypothetical protein